LFKNTFMCNHEPNQISYTNHIQDNRILIQEICTLGWVSIFHAAPLQIASMNIDPNFGNSHYECSIAYSAYKPYTLIFYALSLLEWLL